jgi:transposase-like protein
MKTNFKNLRDFINAFPNEEACRKHFEQVRFAKGDFCPHCKHKKIMRFADGKRYRCHKCRKDFTVKTGTLFGESKLSLQKWFIAIYLLTTSKKGISSISLAEQVGVSQKTAWFMDMRIREALKQGRGKMIGVVEVDETYLGGKHRRKHGFSKKSAIMGMTRRGGKLRAFQVPDRQTHTVLNALRRNVSKKSHLMTDDAGVYRKVVKIGYKHNSVKHSRKQYVRGDVHTNSIESFWSLFKRNYHGTYHSMSKKHLQRYINEVVFRFNNRAKDMAEKFDLTTLKMANQIFG